MQEEVVKARAAAVNGDRMGATVHAHQGLESDLAGFAAALALVEKGERGFGDFDPLAELHSAKDKVVRDVTLCLRQFSPSRTLSSYKGMSTMEALYRTGKMPNERIQVFADLLRKQLSGQLPPSAALDIGRALRRVDADGAAVFVAAYVDDLTRLTNGTAPTETSSATEDRLRSVLIGDAEVRAHFLPPLLRLAIECRCDRIAAGAVGDEGGLVESRRSALTGVLEPDAIAALEEYEQLCRAEYPQRLLREREQEKRREESQAVQQRKQKRRDAAEAESLKVNEGSTKTDGASPTTTTTNGLAAAPRTVGQILSNPLNVRGWRLHATRALLVLVGAFLLRLLCQQGLTLLKAIGGMARGSSAPARRRRLTL